MEKFIQQALSEIYSVPNYFEQEGILKLKNGPVAKHGRGQFGTTVVEHSAGISDYWKSEDNVKGCYMASEYLFETKTDLPQTTVASAGKTISNGASSDALARTSTRTGLIRNFLSTSLTGEITTQTQQIPGSVQASALSLTGPNFTTKDKPRDFISYVHKPLTDKKYKHFGTRIRLVGKIENSSDRGQTANGAASYYVINGSTPDKNVTISGGSGGIAVMLNPTTNVGYYFEIAALGLNKLSEKEKQNVHNVFIL